MGKKEEKFRNNMRKLFEKSVPDEEIAKHQHKIDSMAGKAYLSKEEEMNKIIRNIESQNDQAIKESESYIVR